MFVDLIVANAIRKTTEGQFHHSVKIFAFLGISLAIVTNQILYQNAGLDLMELVLELPQVLAVVIRFNSLSHVHGGRSIWRCLRKLPLSWKGDSLATVLIMLGQVYNAWK